MKAKYPLPKLFLTLVDERSVNCRYTVNNISSHSGDMCLGTPDTKNKIYINEYCIYFGALNCKMRMKVVSRTLFRRCVL